MKQLVMIIWIRKGKLSNKLAKYPTIYRDRFDQEITTIENDGDYLRMVVRGIEFESSMLDDWGSLSPLNAIQSKDFPLHHNELCSCTLDFEISVPITAVDKILSANLRVYLELGAPKENGSLNHEALRLELVVDGKSYKSCGKHGYVTCRIQVYIKNNVISS
jgi:hypothetical protein